MHEMEYFPCFKGISLKAKKEVMEMSKNPEKPGEYPPLEMQSGEEPRWRIWVDTNRKIVSFHEVEGCQLMEFRSYELLLRCVDEYAEKQYRYQ